MKFLIRLRLAVFIIIISIAAVLAAPAPVYAAAGDGMIIYGEDASATPLYRNWTGSSATWNPPETQPGANMQSAAATVNFAVLKASPTSLGAKMAATLGTAAANNLVVQRWNGSSWSSEWTDTNSQYDYRGVDIAFENLSGNAMVVYGDGTSTPKYRTWDPSTSTWSSEQSISLSTSVGTIRWVRLTTRLNSNEIAAIFMGSNSSGTNVNAMIWNGSSWGLEPSGGLGFDSQNGYDSMDAAYETNCQEGGRDLMVAWGTASSPYWAYATLVNTTWTVTTNPSAMPDAVYQMALASSPLSTSNRIAMATMSYKAPQGGNNYGIASAGRWDGSSWTLQTSIDNKTSGYKSHDVDVAFAGTTDNAILVFALSTTGGTIAWYRSVAGGAFTEGAHTAGPGGRKYIITLCADAATSKILEIQVDLQARIFTNQYDEATQSWTVGSGSDPLSTDSSGGTDDDCKESLAFAYDSVFTVPTLGYYLLVILVGSFIAVLVKRKIVYVRRRGR